MTCEQVRLNFEGHLREAEERSIRAEVAEHVSICTECSRYVEEQRALGRSLRMVRESAPALPESLDASVVARYRQYFGQRLGASAEPDRRFIPVATWAWGAAAAVVLAGAAFWFFIPGQKKTSIQTTISTPNLSAPVAPESPAAPRTPPVVATNVAEHRHTATSRTSPKAADRATEVPIRVSRSLPEGFRSLMYCDALSCPGDMEMIRVQLPASAMSRQVPGLIQTSGSVTADVLVGPDGVARGIRLDEIEF